MESQVVCDPTALAHVMMDGKETCARTSCAWIWTIAAVFWARKDHMETHLDTKTMGILVHAHAWTRTVVMHVSTPNVLLMIAPTTEHLPTTGQGKTQPILHASAFVIRNGWVTSVN